MRKIILASSSPRRKELLKQIVDEFEIKVNGSKEITDKVIPSEMVMELAAHKALPVLAANGGCVVIGADTVVVLDGEILGKPKDVADAAEMLKKLSGKTHKVYTGVCIAADKRVDMFYVVSQVVFHDLTEERIRSYVATGSPLDKAGAYGIQDSGFVKEIIGSYTNVMGLPMEELKKHLSLFTEEKQSWQL